MTLEFAGRVLDPHKEAVTFYRKLLGLRYAIIALGFAGCFRSVHAQAFSAATLVADNDFFSIRGNSKPQDQDYTSGIRVTLAWHLPLPRQEFGLAFGQDIYTPRRDAPEPVAGERPYAAWLYLEPWAPCRPQHACS